MDAGRLSPTFSENSSYQTLTCSESSFAASALTTVSLSSDAWVMKIVACIINVKATRFLSSSGRHRCS